MLDDAGALLRSRRFSQLTLGSIGADAAGAPVVAGTFNGTVDVGAASGSFTSGPGGADVLLVALAASDGATRWARQLGEPDRVDPSVVLALGPGDDLYAGASFWSSLGADQGFWIERMDAARVRRFRIRHATTSALPSPELWSLRVDASGAVAAVLKGTFDLGAGPLSASSWLARFDSAGAFEWQRGYSLEVRRAAVDGLGRTWITGTWSGVGLSIRPDPCLFSGWAAARSSSVSTRRARAPTALRSTVARLSFSPRAARGW